MTRFLAFLLVATTTLTSGRALACRGSETNPPNTFENGYREASQVFIGKVTSTTSSPNSQDVTATFAILQSWKGNKSGQLTFSVQTGRSCDLGRFVEVGTKWFVMVNKLGDKIMTASHSHRLFDAQEEKDQIAQLQKFK